MIVSGYWGYVAMEATTTRAWMVTISIGVTDTGSGASITTPLSRIRSRMSKTLDFAGVLCTGTLAPFCPSALTSIIRVWSFAPSQVSVFTLTHRRVVQFLG